MTAKTTVFSLILCLVLASGVSPSENVFSISITVESDNHEAQIKSYLSRELRQLGDVETNNHETEYDLEYKLEVIHTIHAHLHIYSIIVMKCMKRDFLLNNEIVREYYKGKGVGFLKYHGMLLANSPIDIKEACETIVTNIDVEVFEKARRAVRWTNEYLQQSNR